MYGHCINLVSGKELLMTELHEFKKVVIPVVVVVEVQEDREEEKGRCWSMALQQNDEMKLITIKK